MNSKHEPFFRRPAVANPRRIDDARDGHTLWAPRLRLLVGCRRAADVLLRRDRDVDVHATAQRSRSWRGPVCHDGVHEPIAAST
ncbi:hypothetical protein D3C86_1873960 [compost metagenome]